MDGQKTAGQVTGRGINWHSGTSEGEGSPHKGDDDAYRSGSCSTAIGSSPFGVQRAPCNPTAGRRWIRLTRSPDLHSQPTTSALLSLLLAPITSYISILTLLAVPAYTPLLAVQPYATRLSIGQAVVSSVLKNNTQIETPEDVSGVLGLCQVLVKDQKEGNIGGQSRRQPVDIREMAEEQGWVARMVHLFRSDDLGVQFEVSLCCIWRACIERRERTSNSTGFERPC